MTTLAMIEAATPTIIRAPWCVEMNEACMGTLVENGDLATAAAKIDAVAGRRSLVIVEICRVKQGNVEAIFARGEPKPYMAPERDPA